MKYLIFICLLLFILSCKKEEDVKIIDKQLLVGDYIGTTNTSRYHKYSIVDSYFPDEQCSKIVLKDELGLSMGGIDCEWAIEISNNLIVPEQEYKESYYDPMENNIAIYSYKYSGSGELLDNPIKLNFKIFKQVVIAERVIEKDTLDIELIKPEDISQTLSGKYFIIGNSNETIQVEKDNSSDSLIIKINTASVITNLREFKIKPPDLERTNGFMQRKFGDYSFYGQVDFYKNKIDLKISKCALSISTLYCVDYYTFIGTKNN